MANHNNTISLPISLTVIFLLLVLNNIFFFSGYYGYDDVVFSRFANDIISGNFSLLENQFSYRWSAIFTTALAYKIFGYNDFARAIFPIISSVFILYLLSIFTKYKNNKVTLIAIILTITNQWFFYYSDKIMADIYVAVSFLSSLAVIFYYKFYKKDKAIFYAFVLSISLIFGFISKGTIVLIVPVIAVIMINDILQKQNYRFWIFTVGFSSLLLVLYLISIKIITGTYLMRFYVIDANSYINPCSYDQLPTINTIRRISYEFFYELLNSKLFIPIILSVTLLSKNRLKNLLNTKDKSSYIFLAIIMSILSANFMTISYKSYIPMCTDIRHYLFLIPLLAISGAIGLHKFITDKKVNYFVLILFVIAAITLFLTSVGIGYLVYIIIPIVLLVVKFIVKQINISIALITATLMILPIKLIFDANEINWNKHVEIINNNFINTQKTLVITNEVEGNIIDIYSKFDSLNTKAFSYKQIEEINFKNYNNIWWLSYWITDFYNETKYEEKPLIVRDIDSTINYTYIDSGIQLIYQPTPVIFYNNFEDYSGNWSTNQNFISNNVSLSGSKSNFITEDGFSASLTEEISNLGLDSLNRFARISVNYLSEDTSFAQVVISIENDNNIILWHSSKFKYFYSAENKWNKVILEKRIPKVKSGILKVYVWNTDTNTVWIDNFKVIIF